MEAELQPAVETQFATVPPFRPVAEAARVRAAVDLLAKAQKPVIVAGGGVVSSQAQADLVALAEKLQIPVATSLTAKGAISDLHPLSAAFAAPIRVPAPTRSCPRRISSFWSVTTPAAS
jgi:acetolactate synthase-1/2/3 large subunit